MQSLAHYALFGSLAAGIAGAVILALVTLQHEWRRRHPLPEGEEESPQQVRTTRVADTLAVLCFAIAASLGVIGLTQQSRGGADITERMQRLETRLSGAESEIQSRGPSAPDFKSWEERLARLEGRLGAAEERASVADRRLGAAEERVAATDRRVGATEERVATADRRAHAAEKLARESRDERAVRRAPHDDSARDAVMASPQLAPAPPAPVPGAAKWAPVAPASVPPRSAPPTPERQETKPDAAAKPDAATRPEALSAPSAAPAPARTSVAADPKLDTPRPEVKPEVAKPAAPRQTAQAAPSRASRAPAAKPSEPSLGEKLRQDWQTIKREARRSGDDWREGWEQIRRLFTP